MKVNLDDIVDALEMQSEEATHYVDLQTGELVYVDEEYDRYLDEDAPDPYKPEWVEEFVAEARKVRADPDRFLELPSKWDINEYRIMKEFCHSRPSEEDRGRLLDAIRGKGAFRRFKDLAWDLGIIDEWHAYKDRAVERIAKEWCEENGISYFTKDTGTARRERPSMSYEPIRFDEKFNKFSEHWSPRVIAEMNDYQFKLVKIQGEFVWHEMAIEFQDGRVELSAGEMFVVPKAVEHKPVAEAECRVLLIEPRGVVNTGDAGGELTAENDVWI